MEEINLAENEKALHEMREKRKKSKKRKKIIIPIVIVAILLAVIIIGVVVVVIMSTKAPTVYVSKPERGDVESTISVTGNVASDKSITYYAPASAKVTQIAKAGSYVEKGDILVAFDEDDIAYQVAVASLQGDINENSYQQSLAQYNKNRSDYNAAKKKVTEYTDLVNAQQAVVDKIKNDQTDANYNNTSEQNVIRNKMYTIQDKMNQLSKTDSEYIKLAEEYESLSRSLTQLQVWSNTIGATSAEQQNATDAQRLLSEYQEELASAKATVKSFEASATNYDKSALDLNKELAELQANHQMEELDKVLGGICADFNGIVTQKAISEGDTAVAGAGLLTIASVDDVYVSITVTKNDLKKIKEGQKATIKVLDKEYTGTVKSVSKMASVTEKGTSQVTAVVSIDNPDENIYIGIDAKTVISAAKSENCLMLPVEAVYSDDDGDFVYVVEDSIVVKKYITVGISSSKYIEIVDGLTEDSQVMSTIDSNITEGMTVTAVDESAIMSAIGGAVVEETSEE